MSPIHLAIAAASFLSSGPVVAPSDPSVWAIVGQARPAEGYFPVLELDGVPAPGLVVNATISGGAPHGTAVIHFGPLGPDAESATVIPVPERVLHVDLDASGCARRKISWPAARPGEQRAIQAVLSSGGSGSSGPPLTQAWVATTLSLEAALAYSKALDAAEGWAGVTAVTVKDAMVIQDQADRDLATTLIVDHGVLPDIDTPGGVAGPFAVGYVLAHYPPSSPEYNAYYNAVYAETKVGDSIVRLVWKEPGVGSFGTYAIVSGNQVTFDSLMSTMPVHWPEPQPLTSNGPTNFWYEARNIFGTAAKGISTSVPICEGGQAVDCHAEQDSESSPLWSAEVTTQCTASGECCTCTATIGLASGFKTVSVGMAGTGISVSGALGWSSVKSGTYQNCCN